MLHRVRGVYGILMIAGLLLTVSLSVQAQAPTFTPNDCPVQTPQFFEAECGTITVPQDRDNPDAGLVELAVMVVQAGDEDAVEDPLVFVPGGPGSSVLATAAAQFPAQFAPLARQRDVVLVDPRGTGLSRPNLYCTEISDSFLDYVALTGTPEERAQFFIERTDACAERLTDAGVDLSQYNTATIAADLQDIRAALGYDAWNLLTVSYGTRVAQVVMRDYSEGLRSVIIDSPYPLAANLFTATVENVERALEVFIQRCAESESCAAILPDSRAAIDTLLANRAAGPDLVNIPLPDGRNVEVNLTADRVYGWMARWLYNIGDINLLPRRIFLLNEGNYEQVVLSGLQSEAWITQISLGAYLATQCREDAAFLTDADMAALQDAFPQRQTFMTASPLQGASLLDLCAGWSAAGQAPEGFKTPVSSDVPTLIFAGGYDPITPPTWGEQIADGLPNASLLVFEHVGHGVVRSNRCAMLIARNFLNNPAAEPGASCFDTQGGLPFRVDTPN